MRGGWGRRPNEPGVKAHVAPAVASAPAVARALALSALAAHIGERGQPRGNLLRTARRVGDLGRDGRARARGRTWPFSRRVRSRSRVT